MRVELPCVRASRPQPCAAAVRRAAASARESGMPAAARGNQAAGTGSGARNAHTATSPAAAGSCAARCPNVVGWPNIED
jgi:hypothetical protein